MEVQVIKRENQNKHKLKVAAYCRVSTDSEEQEGSLEHQIEHYKNQISKTTEYEFVDVYYDLGVSGYKEKRPGFQKMMRDARNGKMDLIITKSITRFARNTSVFLRAVRELKELNIGVFFELQNINTLDKSGELMMTIYAAFAQGESETYRDLARMTFQRKFAEGVPEYQLQKTMGYTLSEDRTEVIIVPEEAEVIKQLFIWTKENYSPETIVKMSNERGFTTKQGKPITGQWINKTIRNVVYKGDYIMQRCYTDEKRKVHIGQDIVPSYYVKNDHPGIVSRRLWDAANKVIDERGQERFRHLELKPLTDENYPYKPHLFCGKCGGRMHGQKTKSGAQYSFSCGRQNHNGQGFKCGVSVPQKVIESWGPIEEDIYISFDPDKPIHKQHSYVKASTWKKNNKKRQLPPLPEYNEENYPYCKRIFCAECGSPLIRFRCFSGKIDFVCCGRQRFGKEFCSGVRVSKEVLGRLPEWNGYYWIKEEREDGKKNYSYSCKEEKPQRKQRS